MTSNARDRILEASFEVIAAEGIDDPDMDVDRVRILAASRIATELGLKPATLTG